VVPAITFDAKSETCLAFLHRLCRFRTIYCWLPP